MPGRARRDVDGESIADRRRAGGDLAFVVDGKREARPGAFVGRCDVDRAGDQVGRADADDAVRTGEIEGALEDGEHAHLSVLAQHLAGDDATAGDGQALEGGRGGHGWSRARGARVWGGIATDVGDALGHSGRLRRQPLWELSRRGTE